jgi:hypothetical protein
MTEKPKSPEEKAFNHLSDMLAHFEGAQHVMIDNIPRSLLFPGADEAARPSSIKVGRLRGDERFQIDIYVGNTFSRRVVLIAADGTHEEKNGSMYGSLPFSGEFRDLHESAPSLDLGALWSVINRHGPEIFRHQKASAFGGQNPVRAYGMPYNYASCNFSPDQSV